ncbi:ABC transporter permease [Actinoplanes friuliensis]|uniref:Putative exporter of polyketide antibiotics-like protein n=1 Tax=Actinoplanes friuliensis DSM 7358 TaxID=1246995 RepID=U5VZR9_9ACTN|nr:putative exporter of polyketide antibiotics-like protein [Actinoplanes friuliensis]AGZ41141.1 putative exporter of polyketide antibiotics-like protein [Actinoplanes friuliensis DSM 7358]
MNPAGGAVTRLAVRQVRRSALITLGLAATMPALVVATYTGVMADPGAAGSIAALAANPAIRTLFGEPVALDQAGGFTVWRVGTFVAVLLAAWAILVTTRITRGEEDAGRWDVLLAGRVPLRAVVARHLAVVMTVPVAAGAAVTAVLILAGTDPAGAAVHGAGLGALGLFFVAVAGLTAQVFPARAAATGSAVAVLGAGLLMRMVGDGLPEVGWLRRLSPFGLLALSEPYGQNRVLPLLILFTVAVALAGTVLAAAGHRDVGGGLVAAASGRRPRLRLLATVEGFAVRRLLRPLTGWALGIGAYYLLIGFTARSVTEFLADNPALADEAARAGFTGLGAVEGFAATLFALLALPVGGFAAVRVSALVAAETSRHLTLLCAQPVSRFRLLTAKLAATTGGALVLITVAGAAVWVGVTATGGELSLPAALAGAGNTLPIVLLSLGAATFAAGWAPRVVAIAGSLPATGGFLLLVIAESIGAPAWVAGLSPFAHLAPVPLIGVDGAATATMTALAAALIVGGALGYRRRDLQG